VRGVRRRHEGRCAVLRRLRHDGLTVLRVVLGLGFGDEGKGTLVDWLARQHAEPPLVVRYNGGPQAAHHVVVGDRAHCFAQLGSASFVDGARTHLACDMVVDLYALHAELAALAAHGPAARVTIDPRCVLVTPWHAILGRIREALRGSGRHGSTGRGIAEAKLLPERITAAELGSGFEAALAALRASLLARASALVEESPVDDALELLARGREDDLLEVMLDAAARPVTITPEVPSAHHVILESAQGALLDRDHGFAPHVTPSRITRASACAAIRALDLDREHAAPEVWGVLRAYHTRHGEGPLPSYDASLTRRLPEQHNREDTPAGAFRVGWFDGVLARHALSFAGPVDRLAVTCLDRIAPLADRSIVTHWHAEQLDTAGAFAAVPRVQRVDDLAAAIEAALGRRIDVQSWGPRAEDKRLG
jgi:adenylosuccinate synthase